MVGAVEAGADGAGGTTREERWDEERLRVATRSADGARCGESAAGGDARGGTRRCARLAHPRDTGIACADNYRRSLCRKVLEFQTNKGLSTKSRKPLLCRCCAAKARNYLLASSTATATATVAPTMGLLPMPMRPIISTCAGTEEEPANCASECIRPMVSVMP